MPPKGYRKHAAPPRCSVDGCRKEVLARDLCPMHYSRWRKYGDVHANPRREQTEKCMVDACHEPARAKDLCPKHYKRFLKHGDASVVIPPLSGPEHPLWRGGRHVHKDGYIMLKSVGGYRLEHRIVMEAALGRPLRDWETVHHVNGDRADNRLENLQLRFGPHGRGAAFECLDCGSSNVVAVPLRESADAG